MVGIKLLSSSLLALLVSKGTPKLMRTKFMWSVIFASWTHLCTPRSYYSCSCSVAQYSKGSFSCHFLLLIATPFSQSVLFRSYFKRVSKRRYGFVFFLKWARKKTDDQGVKEVWKSRFCVPFRTADKGVSISFLEAERNIYTWNFFR